MDFQKQPHLFYDTSASPARALQEILAQTLGRSIALDAPIGSLALDSYARLVVVAAAAVRGVEIPPAALDNDITVAALAAQVATGLSLEAAPVALLAERASAAVAAHGARPERVASSNTRTKSPKKLARSVAVMRVTNHRLRSSSSTTE